MAKIIVTANPGDTLDAPVMLEESVSSVHLSTGHAAAQLIERLGWAISDAEDAERTPAERRVRVKNGRSRALSPASTS